MALTLKLASQTGLTPQSTEGLPSLTVFAPSSAAFALSSPPSLSLLQYHLLPLPFFFHSFKSLPFGAKISTLLEGRSLFVTTSPSDDQCVSLNNVTVNRSLIYVDGSFIIFGMDEFFDPLFRISESLFSVSFECAACIPNAAMLLGFQGKSTMLTVVAPTDEVIKNRLGSFSEYSRSVDLSPACCALQLSILTCMYFSDWLVVHGVRDIIEAPRPTAEQTEPLQTDQGEDYPYQEPLQTEPMADYTHEAPVKTEVQWKFSSSSGNGFEENATGHNFSTFNFITSWCA
ncbi:hypothetical protein FH972_008587 [Carpinus fangiana]|uniref:FAS1 domain-containing protein n=1 Tax=Carpinus fangiana TaxID=176857 RepID=A0A5N6R022_9ROSI|nr:hypothetical protein FH972_008587 [Carpinus fangiana]